jgi:hypothetical protein
MIRPTAVFRFSFVHAVTFFVAAGAACAQVSPPRPINKPALVLEYDRAIYTIQRGMALHWSDPQLFLQAFDRMSRIGTAGEPLTEEYKVVRGLLGVQFSSPTKERTPWDEQPPATVRQFPQLQFVLQNLTFAREALIMPDLSDSESKPKP